MRSVWLSFAVLMCTRQRFASPPNNSRVHSMLEAPISAIISHPFRITALTTKNILGDGLLSESSPPPHMSGYGKTLWKSDSVAKICSLRRHGDHCRDCRERLLVEHDSVQVRHGERT